MVMKKHGGWWAEMDVERKQHYTYLAEEERVKQIAFLGEAVQHHMQSLCVIEEQIAHENNKKGIASLSACRFEPADFEGILGNLLSIREHKARARLRRQVGVCPEPMSKELFIKLQQKGQERLREFSCVGMPAWSKVFARHRLLFTDAVLHVVRPGTATTTYKFLYAVEKPLLVYWVELEEIDMNSD
eukprot:3999265-Amphidinium_carterae.1